MGRADVLARLRRQIERGRPIVAAGAGIGLSARAEEAGGADLILVYNSCRYRMAGRGSSAGLLPYGDANAIVVEMAAEILPVVRTTPVVAGVCGTDPFRMMPVFLAELKRLGFSGVQNFPTVGLFDGRLRVTLEETGMSFGLEVDMVRTARELDLLTMPYVFEEEEARVMAEAGADLVVPHLGTTASGELGARTTYGLDEAVERIQALHDAARAANPNVIVLCHGGPLAQPEDVAYVMAHTTGVVGYLGASSIEREPAELAIGDAVRRFKDLSLGGEAVEKVSPPRSANVPRA